MGFFMKRASETTHHTYLLRRYLLPYPRSARLLAPRFRSPPRWGNGAALLTWPFPVLWSRLLAGESLHLFFLLFPYQRRDNAVDGPV